MKVATPEGLSHFNFPAGSMGPKVDAVCQFVNSGRGNAAIGSLFELDKILTNEAGTLIKAGEGIEYYYLIPT